jgi:CheY-like chemotaxis protein
MVELKILIVDDIYVNQFLIQSTLENAGLKSKAVCNGKIAIGEIIDNNYDIVFMDIEMPVMNGIEAIKIIRKELDDIKSKIPVIALTAHNFWDETTEISTAGFNEIIYKPYNIEKLITAIKKHTPYEGNFL